jgi:hypothetical protein
MARTKANRARTRSKKVSTAEKVAVATAMIPAAAQHVSLDLRSPTPDKLLYRDRLADATVNVVRNRLMTQCESQIAMGNAKIAELERMAANAQASLRKVATTSAQALHQDALETVQTALRQAIGLPSESVRLDVSSPDGCPSPTDYDDPCVTVSLVVCEHVEKGSGSHGGQLALRRWLHAPSTLPGYVEAADKVIAIYQSLTETRELLAKWMHERRQIDTRVRQARAACDEQFIRDADGGDQLLTAIEGADITSIPEFK